MIDVKFFREREVFLVDVFENIILEEFYEIVLKKLVLMYGKDVLEGVVMDMGFDGIFEIEGEIYF